MSEEVDDILNTVQRWESLGLLDGLPYQDKTELAQIYDNVTKILLSNFALKRIPKKISDCIDEIYIPVCRRLYRRVGPNFDIDNMLSELIGSIDNEYDTVFNKQSFDDIKKDSVVEFCINFADNYSDEDTNKRSLSDEEYTQNVDNVLSTLKDILLNDRIVMYVDVNGDDVKLNLSDDVKPKARTRFANQVVAKQYFINILDKINKK